MREIQCTEVWGGIAACEVPVRLAGLQGELFSQPHDGSPEGGDIHFLSVCGLSILSKIVLADVSGHGAENADVSRIIHVALNETIGAHDNSSMLGMVNDAFLERHRGDFRFTTMVSAIFDSRDRSLVYAYAGHPSILHGTAADGRFRPVEPEGRRRGGIPLGIVPGTEYEQQAVQLAQGDALVFYTDAFTEVRNGDGEFLGEAGLARLLEGLGTLSAEELKTGLLEAVGDRLEDDASLVVLEVL
jgi:sigma-B regulation protein RsbU (phosphoserine phosphatase)